MKYIALFVAAAGLFSACNSDLEKIQILPDDQWVAPVLKDLAKSEIDISSELLKEYEKIEDDEAKKEYNYLIEWEHAFFGEKIPFSYRLSFTYNDDEKSVLTGVIKNIAELTPKQIESALKDLKVPANEFVDIKIRVSAQVGSTGKILYSDYATANMKYFAEVAPVIKKPAVSEVDINTENGSEKFVVEWEDAFLGENVVCNYALSLTYGNKEEVVLADCTETVAELTYDELQDALETLEVPANKLTEIKLRVGAKKEDADKYSVYSEYATVKMQYFAEVAPVIKKLAVSEIEITSENGSERFVVEWEDAFFGKDITCTYALSLTYDNKEEVVLTDCTETVAELTYDEVKTTLTTLEVPANEVVEIQISVSAYDGATDRCLLSDYATAKMSYVEPTEATPENPEGGETPEYPEGATPEEGENTEE